MEPSNNLYEFLKKEEGEVLHAYRDQAGVWTIGIGSTMYKDGTKPKKGDVITHEKAMELLAWEVDNKTSSLVNSLGKTVLNQNQFDALVSLAYNIGVGAIAGSTVLKRVKANPCDPTIRDAFIMWNKITVNGKKVANAGLTARRKREADLYFSTNEQ